jgi:hypothetical protein
LWFFLSFGRFVDWEFDSTVSVWHYFTHQCWIFGIDLFVIKRNLQIPLLLHKLYPSIHFVPTHISYHVIIYILIQLVPDCNLISIPCSLARKSRIIFSLYKNMHHTVGINPRTYYFSKFIFSTVGSIKEAHHVSWFLRMHLLHLLPIAPLLYTITMFFQMFMKGELR